MNFRVVEKHPLDAMAGAFDKTARHQRRFADRAHHLVHHDRRIALRHVDPPDFVLARQQLGLSDGVARLCTSRPLKAPKASLSALNRSRKLRPHSYSRGRCGVSAQKGSAETNGSAAEEKLSLKASRRLAGLEGFQVAMGKLAVSEVCMCSSDIPLAACPKQDYKFRT